MPCFQRIRVQPSFSSLAKRRRVLPFILIIEMLVSQLPTDSLPEWDGSLWNEADSQGLEIQKYFPRALQPVRNGLPAWKMMEEETTTGEGEDGKIWHSDTHKESMTRGKRGKKRIRNACTLCWCCCFAPNWPLCRACGKCHLGITKHKHHEWCNHTSFILDASLRLDFFSCENYARISCRNRS